MQANVLWIIAVVLAIIGVIVIISGSWIWGIILLILAALVGPGGVSIFNRRVVISHASQCRRETFIAFPGHAGRGWTLARWRSLARTGAQHRVERSRR